MQTWVAFVELLHLAGRAPAVVAVPRVAQIHVRDCFETACRVEPGCYLMSDALVLNEAVLASGLNGLLVQTHGIGVPTFDARDLGRYQSVLVGEGWRIVFGPLAKLFPVYRQQFTPPCLLVGKNVLVPCRH